MRFVAHMGQDRCRSDCRQSSADQLRAKWDGIHSHFYASNPKGTKVRQLSGMMTVMSEMSASVNVGSHGPRNSLNDTVALLQEELDELLQQKAAIRSRMRNLRRHLSILQTDSASAQHPRRKRWRSVTTAHRAQTRKIRQLHDELARACRIAFMELGGAATDEELQAAIVRRGSFSFALVKENPSAAITRTLHSMAQSSEVVPASDSRWSYQPQERT